MLLYAIKLCILFLRLGIDKSIYHFNEKSLKLTLLFSSK